jgi:hypothetical protein
MARRGFHGGAVVLVHRASVGGRCSGWGVGEPLTLDVAAEE